MSQPITISGRTRLVPILAHPVDHVRAPSLYNPAFAAAGLDWLQVPMDVKPERLAAVLAELAQMANVHGLNITIPHKSAAYRLCRRIGTEARSTGVVNTLRRENDGNWSGESFDGLGFVNAARAHGVLDPERAVLLVGCGGAGTAIAHALLDAGVKRLVLVNREPGRAEQLASALRARDAAIELRMGLHTEGVSLAVNATSLGLHAGDPLPLDPAALPADTALFDIIAARDTELMAACQARGLRVIGGQPMIDHQIAAQIRFWRGDPIDLEPAA